MLKPYIFCYDFCFKYRFSESLYQTAIFGDNFRLAGMKMYYLKMRNHDRYKSFKGKFIYFSKFQIGFTCIGASFVCHYIIKNKMLGETSFVFKEDYNGIYYTITAPIFTLVFTLFINRGYNCIIDYCLQSC